MNESEMFLGIEKARQVAKDHLKMGQGGGGGWNDLEAIAKEAIKSDRLYVARKAIEAMAETLMWNASVRMLVRLSEAHASKGEYAFAKAAAERIKQGQPRLQQDEACAYARALAAIAKSTNGRHEREAAVAATKVWSESIVFGSHNEPIDLVVEAMGGI